MLGQDEAAADERQRADGGVANQLARRGRRAEYERDREQQERDRQHLFRPVEHDQEWHDPDRRERDDERCGGVPPQRANAPGADPGSEQPEQPDSDPAHPQVKGPGQPFVE